MDNIESVGIQIECSSDVTESSEASDSVSGSLFMQSNVIDNYTQDLNAPINCFHSIFGTDYPDWEEATVKTEVEFNSQNEEWEEFPLKEKITITDLKKEHPGLSFRKITMYEKHSPSKGIIFEPEQVFDKSSARERLKCPNCYFLTDNRGNLKQHIKIHLKSNERALYQCEFCNFKTKYKNSIKGHVQRHELTKGIGGRKKHK